MAKRMHICTSVGEGFPSSDPLAVDLLRLMGCYNDLISLAEWTSYDKELTDDAADNIIRIGRRFVKLRFIASIFYETLKVLEEFEKEPDFGKLYSRFDEEGREALKRLRAVRCGKDPTIRELLDRTRNLVTFHYLRPEFQNALTRMKPNRGEACVFPVVIRYEGEDQRRWYPLAEHLKIDNAFDLQDGEETLLMNLDAIVACLDDLAYVLNLSFDAYIKMRSLERLFPSE